LERHAQLGGLEAALRDASAGRGSVVLVSGEAGAGKTALLQEFVARCAASVRVLMGLCDDLRTPRPLGPFRDMALEAGGRLQQVVEAGSVAELPDALVEELARPPHPVVGVIEDGHWADEATLDVVRFIGRRIGRLPALLVVTYRDDEVPPQHPLRLALGTIPPATVRRVVLAPLSRRAVARLAGQCDIDDVYELTGGNPFYVTEVLSAPTADVPLTVQDAVMARVGRLNDSGRASVEVTSVVPTRTERWLLDGCVASAGVDDALGLGVLRVEADMVSFSHELARRVVEHSLPPARRRAINRRVLDVLASREVDPARLAHHAVEADDPASVARFAPAAARRAASLESHREAVEHFEQALRYPEWYTAGELIDLLEAYAHACYLTGRHDRARSALERVIEMHGETGDKERLGAALRRYSDVLWFLGAGPEAHDVAVRAVAALEQRPPGRALAAAYEQRAKLAIEDRRAEEAIRWGEKAIGLARRLGATDVLVHALNVVGSAKWIVPPFDNSALVESLELAKRHRHTQAVGRAYANLADGYVQDMGYARARRYLEEGLAFCESHDLLTGRNFLLATKALCELEQGRWPAAARVARRVLDSGDVTRITALHVVGLIQARRGDPDADRTLEEAHRRALRAGDSRNLVPLALARAELAWLRGDPRAVGDAAAPALESAVNVGLARWIGEAALWLRRAGRLRLAPVVVAEPYALQLSGRHQEAATRWKSLGRPYEQADALAETATSESLLAALRILDRLGAVPRAAMVRRQLTQMGVSHVPRGPRRATRDNPAGLTARQTEVLRLLAEGLTYRQIAERLHLSTKTVDHHVSAVRVKLDASTRAGAVAAGRRLGILPAEHGATDT
jgi:DNA-binding CsgD family transcriptional regulator/tetratricopeptide (TPR) repeat protein